MMQKQVKLLESVRQLDRQAVATFFCAYAPSLYLCAMQAGAEEETAQELTKDVFVQAVYSISSVDLRDSLTDWLGGILWLRGQGRLFLSSQGAWNEARVKASLKAGLTIPLETERALASRFSEASGIDIRDSFPKKNLAEVPVFPGIVWQEEESNLDVPIPADPPTASLVADTLSDRTLIREKTPKPVLDTSSGARTGVLILAAILLLLRLVYTMAVWDYASNWISKLLEEQANPSHTVEPWDYYNNSV